MKPISPAKLSISTALPDIDPARIPNPGRPGCGSHSAFLGQIKKTENESVHHAA